MAPDAASRALHAKAEVLAALGDTDAWPGEIEVWNEAYCVERYGEPKDVVDVGAARYEPCRMCGTTGACRECDGDGKCASCGGTGLGDYAIDADDECPDCDGDGVCAWCGGAGGCPACSGIGTLNVADEPAGPITWENTATGRAG